MLQLVDSLQLAPHIELICGVEQVDNGGMLVITPKDLLSLKSSSRVGCPCQLGSSVLICRVNDATLGSSCASRIQLPHLLVRLENVFDGEDGEVPVVSEIAQSNAGSGFQAQLVDVLL